MYCPSLNNLSIPPKGKTGWPWVEEGEQLPGKMPNGVSWPKISVVTPSYNQGQFLEETIRSVLLQGYPNLEYIIIDGDSTDNSVEIIKKYEPWLSYWVSETDRGQSHAINKGWKKTTGEIVAYLNSDDTYEPGILSYVGQYFLNNTKVDMIYGEACLIDENGKKLRMFRHKEFNTKKIINDNTWYIPQQAVFIRKRILNRIGFLDENLHFKMDRDLFIRIGINGQVNRIPMYMANFRVHSNAKSTFRNTYKAWKEFLLIRKRYGGRFSLRVHLRYHTTTLRTFLKICIIFLLGENIAEKIRKSKNSLCALLSNPILRWK